MEKGLRDTAVNYITVVLNIVALDMSARKRGYLSTVPQLGQLYRVVCVRHWEVRELFLSALCQGPRHCRFRELPGVRRPERGAHRSSHQQLIANKWWSLASTPTYVFIARFMIQAQGLLLALDSRKINFFLKHSQIHFYGTFAALFTVVYVCVIFY